MPIQMHEREDIKRVLDKVTTAVRGMGGVAFTSDETLVLASVLESLELVAKNAIDESRARAGSRPAISAAALQEASELALQVNLITARNGGLLRREDLAEVIRGSDLFKRACE